MLAEEVGQKQGNLVNNELFTKVNKQLGDTGALQTLAKGDKLTVTVERIDGGKLRCPSSPGSGAAAGGVSTTVKNHHGVGPRRARSIFWKAKTSPGKITTASVHVAPVHRSFPPSTRSTVTGSSASPNDLVALFGPIEPEDDRFRRRVRNGSESFGHCDFLRLPHSRSRQGRSDAALDDSRRWDFPGSTQAHRAPVPALRRPQP